jgi:hypothetical protein
MFGGRGNGSLISKKTDRTDSAYLLCAKSSR